MALLRSWAWPVCHGRVNLPRCQNTKGQTNNRLSANQSGPTAAAHAPRISPTPAVGEKTIFLLWKAIPGQYPRKDPAETRFVSDF